MIRESQMRKAYLGKRVLVTGGLGFIGSNLALALEGLGAQVTVLDSLVPGCGGSLRNLDLAEGRIRVVVECIADARAAQRSLDGCEVVFNLASEIAHTPSIEPAARDLELNVSSQLAFLGHCLQYAPKARVVYSSTRQVYGVPLYLPVDEKHPANPVDFNGVHKLAASQYHQLLWRMEKLDTVVLCLTNVYGPRIALHLPQQGFLANFLARALAGQTLEVFGDGRQLRDPLYVADAVNALLHSGTVFLGSDRVFNIGHPDTHSVLEIARLMSKLANLPEPRLRPFPRELRQIDVGSYATDIRHAEAVLGWRASMSIADGLAESFLYFGRELPPPSSVPPSTGGAAGRDLVA